MCGIAGRVNLDSRRPVSEAVVRAMCDLLAHRGPDGEGVLVGGPAGFGHRRLAIIDLSPGGRQPMVSASGRFWITFNGEIYNFLELRRDLEAEGYSFRSRSDTEVLLASYEAYGADCLRRLRGMFAFAVWDTRDQVLFLARDRVGKKPLFYRADADGLSFASEPKAFLAEPGFEPVPDPTAVSHYLSLQYVPCPYSAFRGVWKLPPAHYLIYRGGAPEIRRYWKLRYAEKTRLSEEEAAEELLARLKEAVRLRLISDVPLGAFLSGGIDSGTVVALMSTVGTGSVKTYSIGFDEADFDELRYARMVAERYATDHHEFVVRPEAAELLPHLVWHYNEPFADSSALPTYCLSKLTRQHVTVALNGDAGDENFAGYDRYVPRPRDEAWRAVPAGLRKKAAALATAIPALGGRDGWLGRGTEWLARRAGSREEQYAQGMMQFGPRLKAAVCTPEFLAEAGRDSTELLLDAYRDSDAPDFLDRTLDVDVRTYLPDALLVKVDIATMAVGLEGRSPFLDHHVMEFAASLPAGFKLKDGVKKYLLKRVARALLPGQVVDRPKKGFSVPLAPWFRNGLRDLLHDVLLSPRARQRGVLRPGMVQRLVTEHEQGRRDWHDQLWNLLMLELWFVRFIDGAPGRARASA